VCEGVEEEEEEEEEEGGPLAPASWVAACPRPKESTTHRHPLHLNLLRLAHVRRLGFSPSLLLAPSRLGPPRHQPRARCCKGLSRGAHGVVAPRGRLARAVPLGQQARALAGGGAQVRGGPLREQVGGRGFGLVRSRGRARGYARRRQPLQL
jgi:hypothetical protein